MHNRRMDDDLVNVGLLPSAEHLLTLLAVAEAGNESSAAERLGIGQSSINRRLASLQEHAHSPLTHRTPAGTRLTPAGAALLPHAREVREALRGAARLMAPPEDVPLLVTLGVSPHLVPRLAGKLASAADSPEPLELSSLEAPSADLLASVRAGRLDAAVTTWAPAGTEVGMRSERLGTDRVVLAALAGGKEARGGVLSVEAARQSRLLLPRHSSLASRGRSFARTLGLPASQVVELPGPAAVRAAVLTGGGVAVTLASYVAADAAAAWLWSVPLSEALSPELSASTLGNESDSVGVWLLLSDALNAEAARRLISQLSEAVKQSAM